MTGFDPRQRFKNHKVGHKANKYVRKFGLHMLPSLYEYYNPMTYTQTQAKGKAVWQS